METHACLENLAVKTNKDENFLAYNDSDAGMIIFTCNTNLQSLCDVDDIFIDGTFKCCPKHFHNLYSIHGCKNGNYVPLLFALLPSKEKAVYRTFWNVVFKLCDDQNLKFEPKTINLEFELGIVNLLREEFREVEIKGCRFHLGQAWYRKIHFMVLHRTTKINLVKLVNGYPNFLDFPFCLLMKPKTVL
jgi:hypothetical protein